jgi:DNA-binding MarR family transcriptional regulator
MTLSTIVDEMGPPTAAPSPPRMPANLKQLLLARSDWFAREIMTGVKRSEFAYITPAQSRLLAHMGGKPTSMSELARRLAISRQAVHKTVAELARRGILEIREDPERGNSKLVVYTERGRQVNRAGGQIIERIEDRVAARIGRERLDELKALLAADWD